MMSVDPRDYVPRLRRYFPHLTFYDPMKRGHPPNPIIICAGIDGSAIVEVRGGRGEYFSNPPARPTAATRAGVHRWVKQMIRINKDLGLRPPTREVLHNWLVRYCDGNHPKCCKWVNELLPELKGKR